MSILNQLLLTGFVFVMSLWLSNIITDLLFGKKDKIEVLPYPPQPNQPMFTTDTIITENTVWLTKDEFFGKTKPTTNKLSQREKGKGE